MRIKLKAFLGTLIAITVSAGVLFASAALSRAADETELTPQQIQQIEAVIERYMLENPQILERVQERLTEVRTEELRAAQRASLARNKDLIFDSQNQVVLGNPEGDVTLVEFFDYNCGYCREATGHLQSLLQADNNLRIVMKEFPILGESSYEAAQVAIAVASQADYWGFHHALMSVEGQADRQSALKAAEEAGLDVQKIEAAIDEQKAEAAIDEVRALAGSLGINGTPSYIIGDEVIVGFVDVDFLRKKIEAVRQCGKATC